ncbi:hypothetical protein Leryth_018258 [Lithospermum erythrorhizon]|uniref:Uncharacterized protein n=1 Tax=Lithospermum erythrorhizon TaxID=34254 RepID=A0AAV3QQY4_LITER|nr:hypothetical protein Leryth_018258 [Lithospermum erythrorhizon]
MLIKMFNSLKSSIRIQPTLFSTALQNQIGGKVTKARFMQQAPGGRQPEKASIDPKSSSKTTDTMSSFGEGYASRSDEEGFGGVYGEKIDDGKTTGHDGSQGSVVKEKETSRNQKPV